jgi:hypothetical protein
LKKIGRGSCNNLFSIWYFPNLHALGYLKSETKIFCEHFWGQQVPQHDVYNDLVVVNSFIIVQLLLLSPKYFEYKYICIETPIITIQHHSLLKIRHRRFTKRLRDEWSVKSSATAENTIVTREQHFNLSFSTFCNFLLWCGNKH